MEETSSTRLGLLFRDALAYAAELHERQWRKGTGIPYVAHLMSVAALALEDGGDEEEATAGLLHDAVEDQGGRPTLAVIQSRFGKRVADIVEACSDSDTLPKPPWRVRKERYIRHLQTASPSVLRVSLADKLDNLRAIVLDYRQIGEHLWSRFNAPRDEVVWYYETLLGVFRERSASALVDELDRLLHDLKELIIRGTPRDSVA